jgi:HEAT repeat protein
MSQLEEQLGRIREKLPLAKAKDSRLEVFGSKSHQYQLEQPLSSQEVEAFEKHYGVQLPEDYRAFITSVGHGSKVSRYGGAGPHYGLFELGQTVLEQSYLTKPCLLYPRMPYKDWQQQLGFLEQDDISDEDYDHHSNTLFQGLLRVGTQGCTYQTCLVLTGEHLGRVVYIDEEFIRTPFFPYEETFLDWYERWLDEVIQGYDVTDFGYFMGGDENVLIQKFKQSSDLHDQANALWSIRKLPVIQTSTLEFLEEQLRHSDKNLRLNAFRLLVDYAYDRAKPVIKTFLHQGDADERLIAVKSLFWYAKPHAAQWVADIASILPSVNDAELFDFIGYVLKESKQDYGELLGPFLGHGDNKIRKQAVYLIGLLNSKARFLDSIMPLLKDNDLQVQLYAVQALSNVCDIKLLPYYKGILQQHQTNASYILSHVLHRLNEFGEDAREVLQESLHHPDEEIRKRAQTLLSNLKAPN